MKNGVVYKYPLTEPEMSILVYENAELLTAQFQERVGVVLWFFVSKPLVKGVRYRKFKVLCTGEDYNGSGELKYVSTIQYPNGLVFHVFEVV